MRSRAVLLSAELEKELPPGHVLCGARATAVATRVDRDDVLFEIEGGKSTLAVVHMTWQREKDPKWPAVKLFSSWDQWIKEEMTPAHEEHMIR